MAVLFLRLLGRFRARLSSGEPVAIPIRKGQALLAYLALNRGDAIARSQLSALLWGDHGDEQARTNLRQTLNVLRKALGPAQAQILRTDRQSIRLDGAALEADALTFQDLIAGGTPADLEAAVSLYQGDLLDGLDLSDPGFQAWLEDERRRFSDMMAGALDALVAHRRAEGLSQDALVHAQRLLTLEPFREDVHRALMVLYSELGRRHAANQQYQQCRELLASELDAEPDAETEALHQALLNRREASAGPAVVNGAVASGQRQTGGGVAAALDQASRRPSPETARVSQGWNRRTAVAGRVVVMGGLAALIWLLAWGNPAVQLPPELQDSSKIAALSSNNSPGISDRVSGSAEPVLSDRTAPPLRAEPSLAATALGRPSAGALKLSGPAGPYRIASSLRADPLLVVASIHDLSGVRDAVSRSFGPARPDRMWPSRPLAPLLAVVSLDDLSGMSARVSDYSNAARPAEAGAGDAERSAAHNASLAAQREADALWSGLAESWDLRAVRAFKARYHEARQLAEADRRIAFLIRHQREAQAGLDRLGYDPGPIDGVWGPRSARALRAFQSDHGFTPDGVVSAALLDGLETASPKITMASIPAREAESQVGYSQPQIAIAPPPPAARDGAANHSRWTAFGRSSTGSTILATATRRGDTLEIVFDVDHRRDHVMFTSGSPTIILEYVQTCTASVAGKHFECWVPKKLRNIRGAKVFGTFPRLTYELQPGWNHQVYAMRDVVLDFRPELHTATLEIVAQQ